MEKENPRGGKMRPVAMIAVIALCALIAAVIITALINKYMFSMIKVTGAGMEPAIYSGERWLIDKRFDDISRGDIVVFNSDDGGASISRVAAVGGDSVYIDMQSGRLYVNGELADEPYAKISAGTGGKFITELQSGGNYSKESPYVVEDGYIFVLGDNRGNSRDSREFGPVPESAVFGIAARKLK